MIKRNHSLLNTSLNNAWGKKISTAKYGTDHVDNLSLILDKVYMQYVTKYANSELQS